MKMYWISSQVINVYNIYQRIKFLCPINTVKSQIWKSMYRIDE